MRFRLIALILVTSIGCFTLRATHIVGGELTYKFLYKNNGLNVYTIKLALYIDCYNGSLPAIQQDFTANFNVFDAGTKSLLKDYCRNVQRTDPVRVSDLNYKCIITKPNACVDAYYYTYNLALPVNPRGYIISFERCCRNNSINNIVNPENTGATYWTEIKDPNTHGTNSSATFNALPPNFLCTNAPLTFNHSATDIDGDSLVYELYTPYIGAKSGQSRPDYNDFNNLPNNPDFVPIEWISGYNEWHQINGQPTLTIDRFSGKLSLTPTLPGQFVIGIKVLEFRKGKLISETRRDFQFNVSNCVFQVLSSFLVPKYNCTGNDVSFINRSTGATSFHWNFGDPWNDIDTSIVTSPVYTYPKPGTYVVRLVAKSTLCSDTFDYDIHVKKNFITRIGNDTLICGDFTKTIHSGFHKFQNLWNTGATTESITVNKGGKYIVKVTDAPCTSSDTIEIINDRFKLDLGPDSVICRDSFVQFTYTGPGGLKTYLWQDSTRFRNIFISKLGTYHLWVTNVNDCPGADSLTFILYPPPHLTIDDTSICRGDTVILDATNTSPLTNLETTYLWNTDEKSARIAICNSGQYTVRVRNKLCTILDTAELQHIDIGLDIGIDTFYCGPVHRYINASSKFLWYLWQDGSSGSTHLALSPGVKIVKVESEHGCIESDSIEITQFGYIHPELPDDTTICVSSKLHIQAVDSFIEYLWSTGETSRSIEVTEGKKYLIRCVDYNGCIVYDSVDIKESPDRLPNELYMPTAFSPNNDNLNEVYPGNKYGDPGATYQIRLFNRWGEKIFESDTPSGQWDGLIKGNPAPQDVYVFHVVYVGCDNSEREFRGTFTLIR